MLPAQPNQSLIEGVRCLKTLSLSGKSLGAVEVSRLLKIESTKAHRLLKTLAHLGLAHQCGNRKFQAGPGLSVLAAQSLLNTPLWQTMREPLQELQSQIPYEVKLGLSWEGAVFYFFRGEPEFPAEWAMGRMDLQSATRSGIGMALLSCCLQEKVEAIFIGGPVPGFPGGLPSLIKTLRQIKSRGYAFVPGADSVKKYSLAVSQEDKSYAISLSGPIEEEEIPELVILLRHTLHLLRGPQD